MQERESFEIFYMASTLPVVDSMYGRSYMSGFVTFCYSDDSKPALNTQVNQLYIWPRLFCWGKLSHCLFGASKPQLA